MTNDLAKTTATLPGLLPDMDAWRLADSFRLIEEGTRLLADRMPSAGERTVLFRRLDELNAALLPIMKDATARAEVKRRLGLFFLGYPSMRNAAPADTVNAYVMDLAWLPRFAIERACVEIKKPGVDPDSSLDHPPSSARLSRLAEKIKNEVNDEAVKIARVLRVKAALPPPPDPTMRERVGAKFRSFAEGMKRRGSQIEAEDEAARAKREAAAMALAKESSDRIILAEYRRLGIEPIYSGGILISPALARR